MVASGDRGRSHPPQSFRGRQGRRPRRAVTHPSALVGGHNRVLWLVEAERRSRSIFPLKLNVRQHSTRLLLVLSRKVGSQKISVN
jgi:hypothetical protein